MDSEGTPFRLADDDSAESLPQVAASGASSHPRPVVETIDFFSADEKKPTPTRPPPPADHRDLSQAPGFQMLPLSITPPSAAMIHDERYGEKFAAAKAEVRRAYEYNRRLTFILHDVCGAYDALRQSRPSTSSKPHDGIIVPRPLHLDVRPPPHHDVTESSNSAALRGHSQVGPVDDGGRPMKRKEKEVIVDEAPNVNKENIEDDDQHRSRNSNKKLKLSSPPPEKDEKAAAMRKPRVIVRFRTETDDINGIVKIDGCQWRKYGQKIPKSSPKTPRCYYRCRIANECPMRKHLQKCADDESIVNATYEGAHNHPLPHAAIPMARATAAALELIMSGSMPSGEALMDISVLAATMPPGARVPRTATVSISSPFPTALLNLSKTPDPALFQGQPAVAQFQAASPGRAAPGKPSRLPQAFWEPLKIQTAAFPVLQMSPGTFSPAFVAILNGAGGAAGCNGGPH